MSRHRFSCTTMRLFLVALALASQTIDAGGQDAVNVEALLKDPSLNEDQLVLQIHALGLTAEQHLEVALASESGLTRRRALRVLSRLPERRGVASVLSTLRSKDEIRSSEALACCPELLSDAAFAEAWLERFVGDFVATDGRETALNLLLRLDEQARTSLAPRLLDLVNDRVASYDHRALRTTALAICVSAPSDANKALRVLARMEDRAETISNEKWKGMPGVHSQLKGRASAAIECAGASLGNSESLQSFEMSLLSEDRRKSLSRLRLLRYCLPTPEVLNICFSLLADKTALVKATPAHHPSSEFRRRCDFAIGALDNWFEDFPIRSSDHTVHSESDILLAEQWLRQRYENLVHP